MNNRLKKLCAFVLCSAMLFTLTVVVGAAESAEPTIIKSLVDEDGTVLSEYSDGSKRAVDSDGNLFIFEKDGTSKSYFADGSTLVESPNGSKVSTETDGSMISMDADGSTTVTDKHGISTRYGADGSMTTFFKDGTGALVYDIEKGYSGTTVSKNGMTLEMDGDNYRWTFPGGGLVESNENGVDIQHADGSYLKMGSDNSVSMKLEDGSTIELDADGYGEMLCADGSYKRESADGVDYYDAETGDRFMVNTAEGKAEFDFFRDNFHHVAKDGVYRIENTVTGDYLQKNADGTTTKGNTQDKISVEPPVAVGGPLSLENISGLYQNENANFTYKVYPEGGGVIVEAVYNPDAGPMSYDESSGVAYLNDGRDDLTCTFSQSGDTIRVEGDCYFYGSDGKLLMHMTFSSIKID